jgi:Fe(3+) dicitrate transport protein
LNGQNNTTYLYTTNIGNALAKGIEASVNVSLWKLMEESNQSMDIRIFNSMSYNNARYTSGAMNYNGENKNLSGNHLEGVPDWINRTGLEFKYKGILTTLQTSSVSENYSDANNTTFNATGATGIVPSYRVWDWSFAWSFLKIYTFSSGVNNLTNLMYFTRRINMYPGPGILPADGRTFYLSLGIKI